MLLRDDLFADLARALAGCGIRNPIEPRHQFRRPHVRRRIPVALETKRHIQRLLNLRLRRHQIDLKPRRQLELLNESKPVAGDYPASVTTTWAMNWCPTMPLR